MKGTLCISSIPNSSSSLCYGKRPGGEEGERMEIRVRKESERSVMVRQTEEEHDGALLMK